MVRNHIQSQESFVIKPPYVFSRLFNPQKDFQGHAYCTLGNFFGNIMDDPSATSYMGVTWNSFRDIKHAMEKIVLKIRPNPFNPNGGSSKSRQSSRMLFIFADVLQLWSAPLPLTTTRTPSSPGKRAPSMSESDISLS